MQPSIVEDGHMNNVATTILEQLGGRKLIAMAGAHSFTSDVNNNSLVFKVPSRSTNKHIAAVKITLTAADDYVVEFYAFRGSLTRGDYRVETVSKHEGICCDQLQGLFEDETGLLTNLVGRTVPD
jgi:hypothetical protein